jgi:hypothetical protein
MRTRLVAIAAVSLVGSCGVAVAATPASTNPTLADCVKAWNAAPVLRTTLAAQPAAVDALGARSFNVTWSKTSKKSLGPHSFNVTWAQAAASLSGPGCIISIGQAKGHSLVIDGKWAKSKTIKWRRAVAMSGLAGSNATIHQGGKIALR